MKPLGLGVLLCALLTGQAGATEASAEPSAAPTVESAVTTLSGLPTPPDPEHQPDAMLGTGLRAEVPGEAAIGLALQREIKRGKASWYGKRFHGRRTASGERFNMYALTAAHPSLPFGTLLRVRHLESGREVVVRVNDRGPFARGRILDLSHAAADALGMIDAGETQVALHHD